MSTKSKASLRQYLTAHPEVDDDFFEVWYEWGGAWYCEDECPTLPSAQSVVEDIREESAEDGLDPPPLHIVRVTRKRVIVK